MFICRCRDAPWRVRDEKCNFNGRGRAMARPYSASHLHNAQILSVLPII